ncbi:MAG: TPM domain-containing protein [Alteraurantiacibacter sp.]
MAAIAMAASLAACAAEDAAPLAPLEQYAEKGGRVRDGADVLDAEFEEGLTQKLADAEDRYGYQLGVATVTDLGGYGLQDYARRDGNEWHLGDNGILLLLVMGEEQVRIETGAGVRGAMTDAFCQTVIDDAIVPSFQREDFETGISDATRILVERMRANPKIPANDNAPLAAGDAA